MSEERFEEVKAYVLEAATTKKVQVEDGEQADVVEDDVPRYDSLKINHNAPMHMNEWLMLQWSNYLISIFKTIILAGPWSLYATYCI